VNVRSSISLSDAELPEALRKKWNDEYAEAIATAREAYRALEARDPRIQLLFGRYSPAGRSTFLAHASLSVILHDVAGLRLPEGSPSLGEQEPLPERNAEHWRSADRAINEFSTRAREAILAPAWSVRPVFTRARYSARHASRPFWRRSGRVELEPDKTEEN
jgi:hypothetical protein